MMHTREPLQMGAELYGHAGVESDVEIQIGFLLRVNWRKARRLSRTCRNATYLGSASASVRFSTDLLELLAPPLTGGDTRTVIVMIAKTTEDQFIRNRIHEYLVGNQTFDEGHRLIGDDLSLLENGFIDPVSLLELELFVEEAFGIDVRGDDVNPDNFDSVNRLVAFVRRKRRQYVP